MEQRIRKRLHNMGASRAIVLPKEFLIAIGITSEDTHIVIELDGDRIVIRRIPPTT